MVDDQGDKNPAQDGTSANFGSGAGYNRTRALKHPRRLSVRRAASFTPSQMISAMRPVWTGVVGRPYQSSRIGTVPLVNDGQENVTAPVEIGKRPAAKARGRLRVLHIINDLSLGGAETLLYRLTALPSTVEHRIVSLGPPEWYSKPLEERGIRVEYFDMRSPLAMASGIFRLRRLIRESGADVVQCWLYRSNVVGGLAARIAGVPVAWGVHCSSLTPLKYSSRALAYLSGLLAPFVPGFIINCSKQSAELHSKLGYAAAPGAVIHNGYDPARFYPDAASREAMRKRLGIAPGEFVIGSLARWHPQKDIPNLLSALRIVSDRGVPVRCLLIGNGLDEGNPALMQEIRASRCEAFVSTLGMRRDVPELARAMDLHVLASCGSEAFPNAVAETMLSGTPNVVTDVGDSALIVDDAGWVVPPRSPAQLADAIVAAVELKADPEGWEQRRAAARERIAQSFTEERMAEAYSEVWYRLAGDSAGAAPA
jgi:glycosyltransferase involved in cell wall biosynthesis